MKGVRHYTKEGKTWKGGMHKMKNGDLHSGKTHTKSSQKLYHFGELSKKAKVNAKKSWRKNSIAPSMKKLGKKVYMLTSTLRKKELKQVVEKK